MTWASSKSSPGAMLVCVLARTVSTPRSMKPGSSARARIRAWIPRNVRCWLADRSKSPPGSDLRIRENAIAAYPLRWIRPALKPFGLR